LAVQLLAQQARKLAAVLIRPPAAVDDEREADGARKPGRQPVAFHAPALAPAWPAADGRFCGSFDTTTCSLPEGGSGMWSTKSMASSKPGPMIWPMSARASAKPSGA